MKHQTLDTNKWSKEEYYYFDVDYKDEMSWNYYLHHVKSDYNKYYFKQEYLFIFGEWIM